MGFDLRNYKDVATRITEFWEKYPNGAIETELISDEIVDVGTPEEPERMSKITFKAILKIPNEEPFHSVASHRILATGYAQETEESSKIDKYFENTETSAVGRALANANFGVKNDKGENVRPSKQEMESAERAGERKKKFFPKKR